MFVCFCDRKRLLRSIQSLKCEKIIELGVHRGDNASFLLETFKPGRMLLVDEWSSSALISGFSIFDPLPPGVDPLSAHDGYYGGPIDRQETFDANHQFAVDRFRGRPEVVILRLNTVDAFQLLQTGGERFDLIYVDASHQYEYVLNDLKLYSQLLTENGAIVMNDVISSPLGRRQNLGVLEAVGAFVKAYGFVPIAVTATDYADLILCRSEKMAGLLGGIIAVATYYKLNLPPEMLFSFKLTEFHGSKLVDFGSADREFSLRRFPLVREVSGGS